MYDIIAIRHLCNKTIVLMGVSYVFNIIEYQYFLSVLILEPEHLILEL